MAQRALLHIAGAGHIQGCKHPGKVYTGKTVLHAPTYFLLHTPPCTSLSPAHTATQKCVCVCVRVCVQTSRLQPEESIPSSVLAGACGLVIMSLVKVGAGWSATFGTGVVVSRNSAGQWSAPCAVAAAGVGWGFQIGGELTDLLLVLRTPEAVSDWCRHMLWHA